MRQILADFWVSLSNFVVHQSRHWELDGEPSTRSPGATATHFHRYILDFSSDSGAGSAMKVWRLGLS